MAEQSTSSVVISADPAAIMAVIADFEAYPDWASGVKRTTVLEPGDGATDDGGRARSVEFQIDAKPIKDTYSLGYTWHGDSSVDWTLVDGGMMKAIDGEYALTPLGDGTTEVRYSLAVELAIPMIGMLRRKAEKVIIETALNGLKKRVESLGGR